jgi:transcriptional regulator with XRE-family HTH domain
MFRRSKTARVRPHCLRWPPVEGSCIMIFAAFTRITGFAKEEGSRRRQSWAERWEEDRQTRRGLLPAVASEAEEAPGRSASQAQEIPLRSSNKNNERSLYNTVVICSPSCTRNGGGALAMRINVGGRLKAERKARRFSQADLEQRCGLPRCRISWLENGRAVPTIETLEKLCDALEIPLHQLFGEGDQPAKKARTASERIVAKGRGRSRRTGQRRFLTELRQELQRLCEDDLDLLLYIARTLANRGFRRLSFERRETREKTDSVTVSGSAGTDL